MKLSIVIPCLNEAKTIEKVVNIAYLSAQKHLQNNFEIIVADNGSTDGTLEKLARIKNIRIINVPIKGYGAALHYGILSTKSDYVLFADADLSYDFKEIKKFVPFIDKNCDLVSGSRIKGKITPGAMPFSHRFIGTPILTWLIKLIYKISTSDCNSGMRMVKKSFYKKLNMKNSGMEWDSELLIKTALNNGSYIEVPITLHKDQRGKLPHLKSWEDGWRNLKVIIMLKPSILILIAVFLLSLGIFALNWSIFTTIAMFLFSELSFFSYLALSKLQQAIEKKSNNIVSLIEQIPLVLTGVIITIGGFISMFLISDAHLFTKYIILSQVVIYDLWLFFIETIKTHLVNPLPEKIYAIN